ncbi:Mismatch repair ATPase {MutS family} [Geoglobus ahangari]|uniref:Mismatch repair ATPase (MutS family) n=1 Tax=Geoglobus ahangari TaxID=113653 RepID=A0A0F7DBD1_9EURY|nr:hypothetical protein [Geoglobus ahangari]AKG90881.1 Mismatch repair ATPase {MutS family} [Geoglobus ahangari]
MELVLSGDARTIYSRLVDAISKKAGIAEALEELKSLKPLSSAEEILRRQEEVRRKMELAARVSISDLSSLERFRIGRRFFEDRVFVARDDGEYEKAVRLNVCEVVREDERVERYAINLSDFVSDISLSEFAPELIVEALMSNIDTLKRLARLEQELHGKSELSGILSELEDIREAHKKVKMFDEAERIALDLQERINREVEERLAEIKLTLTADELLKMVGEGRVAGEIESEIERVISKYEEELHELGIYDSVFHRSYPVRIDTEALKNAVDRVRESYALDYYLRCRKIAGKIDLERLNERVEHYRRLSLYRALIDLKFAFPEVGCGTAFINGVNLFISNPQPVSYCIGENSLFPHSEGAVILTGANSGGKTSLLDLICQISILFHMGLPVNAERAECAVYDEIFYFRRKRSSYGSGAFERALKSLVRAISGNGRKLILIDEFEAITEPGAGARILATLLEVASRKGHHVVLVSHLGEEFAGLDFIRIDGIEAKGLDENFNLIVDRQPVFGRIGRSTPELIVERLMEKSRGEVKEIFSKLLRRFGQE